ncbi:hypothetical protein A6X21_01355 [Planctopirus hydrillae]|uniref:Uncharacterized protein n=1 Tax=Planctopirus hydrillae TaxID=1841610 RepID=A0A1C3E4Z0_9PLAN|nr:hypothetical protein A6X21_01355 [Planctopirus hydrillae]
MAQRLVPAAPGHKLAGPPTGYMSRPKVTEWPDRLAVGLRSDKTPHHARDTGTDVMNQTS